FPPEKLWLWIEFPAPARLAGANPRAPSEPPPLKRCHPLPEELPMPAGFAGVNPRAPGRSCVVEAMRSSRPEGSCPIDRSCPIEGPVGIDSAPSRKARIIESRRDAPIGVWHTRAMIRIVCPTLAAAAGKAAAAIESVMESVVVEEKV